MKRLKHLQKFIYEDSLIIKMSNEEEDIILRKQFNC